METNRAKISERQRTTLIEFMKDNPNLLSSKFSASFTYKNAQEKWEEITLILNSVPGARKNWKSWKITWQDLRSRTKMKYSKNRNYSRGTGGGPYIEDAPTHNDEEIFEIIKPVCLEGHEGVTESTCEIIDIIEIETPENNNCNNIVDATVTEKIIPVRETLGETPSVRKIPRRPITTLRKTDIAVENYQNSLKKKISIKENYYKEKLEILREKNQILRDNNLILQSIESKIEKMITQ